jgi:DNA-binding ferritin-like protein (Dps family)
LALFNKHKIIFKNYKLAALLSEYIISELTGEQMYIMKLLTSVNGISKATIRRWYKKVKEITGKEIDIILDRLLDEYSKEFKSLFNKNE